MGGKTRELSSVPQVTSLSFMGALVLTTHNIYVDILPI
jgi:hypothetical protein